MPDPVTGTVAATSVGGSLLGNRAARKGASRAADAQVQAAQMGIDESARQFDFMQNLLNPYVEAGAGALEQMQNLDYASVAEDPLTQQLIQQQENALLQNASATGGLRGGNIQGALAEFRPQLIQQQLQNQYNRLGGIAQMGYSAAGNLGSGAMQTGQQAVGLLGQSGAAQAGSHMAGAQAQQRNFGALGALGTDLAKLGAFDNLSLPSFGGGGGYDYSQYGGQDFSGGGF